MQKGFRRVTSWDRLLHPEEVNTDPDKMSGKGFLGLGSGPATNESNKKDKSNDGEGIGLGMMIVIGVAIIIVVALAAFLLLCWLNPEFISYLPWAR